MAKARKVSAVVEALGDDFLDRQQKIAGVRAMLAPLTDAQVGSLQSMAGLPADEVAGALGLDRQLVDATRECPAALGQEAFMREMFGKQLGGLKVLAREAGSAEGLTFASLRGPRRPLRVTD